MAKRYVVSEPEGLPLAEALRRANADPAALSDGRVFVGARRASNGAHELRAGDVVTVASPRAGAKASASADGSGGLRLLAREGDVVAFDKPAGLPTIADHGGAAHTLVAYAARALGVTPAEVHPTSRLDRDVSGVVVVALGKEARERLARARDEHRYARRYVGLACLGGAAGGAGDASALPAEGTWDAPIGRASDPRHRAAFGRDATHARTHFAVVARAGAHALLALAPITGRTHQLRVHAAHAGAPLLGDRVYGAARANLVLASGAVVALNRVALHAARVTLARGTDERWDAGPFVASSKAPELLVEWWRKLGGEPSAWDRALSCSLPDA